MADVAACLPSKPSYELVLLLAHYADGETEAQGLSNLLKVTQLGFDPLSVSALHCPLNGCTFLIQAFSHRPLYVWGENIV